MAVIRPNFFLVLGEQRDRLDLRPQNQNLFLFLCLFHCLNLALITGDACEDRMIQHGIFLVVQPPEQETQPGVVCGMGILVAGENDQHLVAALFQQMQERDRVNDAAVYIVSAVQLYRFTDNGQGAGCLDCCKQALLAACIGKVRRLAVLAAGGDKIGLHRRMPVCVPADAAGVLVCHVIQVEKPSSMRHVADAEITAVAFHNHHFQSDALLPGTVV